jgi:hypothetical protein
VELSCSDLKKVRWKFFKARQTLNIKRYKALLVFAGDIHATASNIHGEAKNDH